MVSKTNDLESVARIFNHPKVYRWISDDLSAPVYVPDPSGFYVMNEEKTGVAKVEPFTGTACMVHIAALPELWGKTPEFVKEGAKWLFSNTRYTKIISVAPECNRLALRLGDACGFKREGKITNSFLKNWRLYDMIVFGLSKYDGGAKCQ